MNLTRPLPIKVFYKDAKECELEELGIALPKGQPRETEEITIYSLDYVGKASLDEDGVKYGTVSSGGEEFITVYSYKDLLSMIEKAMPILQHPLTNPFYAQNPPGTGFGV